jgi:hypothetical protein
MHTARRLSAFVRTNALLANLCDRKKSLRQRDPKPHRRRPYSLRNICSIPVTKAAVRSMVSFHHLLPKTKKRPALQISLPTRKVGAVFKYFFFDLLTNDRRKFYKKEKRQPFQA